MILSRTTIQQAANICGLTLMVAAGHASADGVAWKVQDTAQVQGVWACSQEAACNRAIGISDNPVGYSCPGGNGTRQNHYQLAWEANDCHLYRIREQCGVTGGPVNVGTQGIEQQSYIGQCPYDDPAPSCDAGTQGGQVIATADGQDGCDSNGCAVVTHARTDDSLAWGINSPADNYIAESTMVGGQCVGNESQSPVGDYQETINGVDIAGDAQNPNCSTFNGDQICSGQGGTGTQCYEVGGQSYCANTATNCINTPSGGRVCAVNSNHVSQGNHLQNPGVPNDGTGDGETPAQPDLQIDTGDGSGGGGVVNYYTNTTINNSTGDVGEGTPQPTPAPTASPSPGECEQNTATCDAETNTDALKQAAEERHDEQTKDATEEQGWADPDTSFFDGAPMISPGDSCPTVNYTIRGKDLTFPSPSLCAAFAQMRQALAWLLYMFFIFDSLGVLSRTLKAG